MIEGLARQILQHYGMLHQKSKTIEELAELIVALQKDILKGKEEHSRAVLEEIADVKIMLMQMLFDEDDEEFVEKIMRQKLDRQLRRIKAEKDSSKACKNCVWYKEQFEHAGVCVCTRSDQCGDFVDDKMICPEWERG
jgi:hypothetical protein|nr:MAG TPA: nucleoside triphosphate pyrophosphohydrolase [Caudoviricetes sp.]